MIQKKLKNCSFVYHEESKIITISDNHTGEVKVAGLTRIEMFSLMRFIIRIAQKSQKRRVKK